MKLNKLFPKVKMNEIFSKFGFSRQDSKEFIVYANQFISSVIISRPIFQKNIFFLDCNAIAVYNLKINGYKREWREEEYRDCISFIENTLLPQICYLKGPFKIDPNYYFNKIEELLTSYTGAKGERGNKNFMLPFDDSEREENYNYLKYVLDENRTLFFLNDYNLYEVLI